MVELSLADARARFSDVVEQARTRHQPVYLTHAGKRVAAVIDVEDLDRLVEAAEDLPDIQAARAARAEMAHTPTIPFDVVKRELGLE